jgi:hypothetical protein
MDRRHALLALGVVVALVAWAIWPSPHSGTTDTATRKPTAGAGSEARNPPPVPDARLASSRAPVAPWVVDENHKAGTGDWVLTNTGRAHDIEGYADHVSAQRGDAVQLMVSTTAPSFHVDAYRMGYYAGLGGRLVWRSADVVGVRQADPVVVPVVNMVDARWKPSLRVAIDANWPPGAYLLKLVASTGPQRFIPLTVRDDSSQAAYVLQSSVATWQAYNLWGNYSLYLGGSPAHPSLAQRARIVSFDRPFERDGASDFIGNELPLISLAESRGLDVTYWTDVDLHRSARLLLNHRALLTLGHDEYWSTAMRTGAATARDHGVNLAFLGANAVFRHVRFESSPLGADRHVVDYKSATEDPTPDKNEKTVDWRGPPLDHPESALIGQQYECNPVSADMVVFDESSWLLSGTGLRAGTHLPKLVGTEYDRYVPSAATPPNVEVIAHSPVQCRAKPSYSDMTYFSAPSGAGVFATGTGWWVNSLIGPCPQGGCRHSDLVVAITWNLLEAFGSGPAGLVHPSVSNADRLPNRGRPTRGEVSFSPGVGRD